MKIPNRLHLEGEDDLSLARIVSEDSQHRDTAPTPYRKSSKDS